MTGSGNAPATEQEPQNRFAVYFDGAAHLRRVLSGGFVMGAFGFVMYPQPARSGHCEFRRKNMANRFQITSNVVHKGLLACFRCGERSLFCNGVAAPC